MFQFSIKIEDKAAFYFCRHFYGTLKDEKALRNSSVVNSRTLKEVVAFCDFCRKEIQPSTKENINPLSNSSSN